MLIKERQKFFNIYRTTSPAPNIVSALYFAITKVGQWRQIGIMVSTKNTNLIEMSLITYQYFNQYGIQVVDYLAEETFDKKAVGKINQKRVKILLLFSVFPQDCVDFLCSAWHLGLKAPYYIFLSVMGCYLDLTVEELQFKIPNQCNLEIIEEQLKITLNVGPFPVPVMNHGPTSFGYDLKEFEMMFQQETKGLQITNEPLRYMCHDAMMAALVTLNSTISALALKNLTFSDYQNQSSEIFKITNNVASDLDFQGLRIGRIRYSPRIEVDDEPFWIFQLFNSKPRMLYRAWRPLVPGRDNYQPGSLFNLSTWQSLQLQAPLWMTGNGEVPKDMSEILQFHVKLSKGAFLTIVTITLALTIAKMLGIVVTNRQIKDKFIKLLNIYSNVGCLLLDFASCFLLAISKFPKQQLCHAWLAFSIAGFITIALATFAVNLLVQAKFPRKTSPKSKHFGNRYYSGTNRKLEQPPIS